MAVAATGDVGNAEVDEVNFRYRWHVWNHRVLGAPRATHEAQRVGVVLQRGFDVVDVVVDYDEDVVELPGREYEFVSEDAPKRLPPDELFSERCAGGLSSCIGHGISLSGLGVWHGAITQSGRE